MCRIQAHVVHVDMIHQNEMGLKLTEETIQALIEFYDDLFSHQVKASFNSCSQKVQVARSEGLRQDFVKAVNDFVCRPC